MSGPRGTKRLDEFRATGGLELIGKRLGGRYDVEALLGQGGMGSVYLVRHAALGRSFALKVLRRELCADAETVTRFVQEAKIAATIRHEALVDVVDFGEIGPEIEETVGKNKAPYFVMEMLEGETLAQRLEREGPLDVRDAATIFAAVADALAAAHAGGVIHRDLKPDNVFLCGRRGATTVKVLDFGVAKILSAQKMTRVGTVFGTPYYMSPEQAAGDDIDPRSDQYGLGVVLYEALSGRVPFDDDTYMGVLTKHVFADPEPIEKVVRDPSKLGPLAPIVMRCLAKRATERFADANELAAALRAAASSFGAGQSAAASSLRRPPVAPTVRDVPALALPPPASRSLPVIDEPGPRWWIVGGAASLVVVAVALGVVVMTRGHRADGVAQAATPPATTVAPAETASPAPSDVSSGGVAEHTMSPPPAEAPSSVPSTPDPKPSSRPTSGPAAAAATPKSAAPTAVPAASPKHPVLEPVW